jgi:hypothetical protein
MVEEPHPTPSGMFDRANEFGEGGRVLRKSDKFS